MNKVVDRILKLTKRKGWSIRKLCVEANFNHTIFSKVKGGILEFTDSQLRGMATALQVTVEDLIFPPIEERQYLNIGIPFTIQAAPFLLMAMRGDPFVQISFYAKNGRPVYPKPKPVKTFDPFEEEHLFDHLAEFKTREGKKEYFSFQNLHEMASRDLFDIFIADRSFDKGQRQFGRIASASYSTKESLKIIVVSRNQLPKEFNLKSFIQERRLNGDATNSPLASCYQHEGMGAEYLINKLFIKEPSLLKQKILPPSSWENMIVDLRKACSIIKSGKEEFGLFVLTEPFATWFNHLVKDEFSSCYLYPTDILKDFESFRFLHSYVLLVKKTFIPKWIQNNSLRKFLRRFDDEIRRFESQLKFEHRALASKEIKELSYLFEMSPEELVKPLRAIKFRLYFESLFVLEQLLPEE